MLFCLVLSIAGGSILALSGNSNATMMNNVDGQNRFFAAEAGLSLGLAWVRAGGLPPADSVLLNSRSINGNTVEIKVMADGWVISTVPNPTPTAENPLQWKQVSQCSVTVSNAPVANSIVREKCSTTSTAVTFP